MTHRNTVWTNHLLMGSKQMYFAHTSTASYFEGIMLSSVPLPLPRPKKQSKQKMLPKIDS